MTWPICRGANHGLTDRGPRRAHVDEPRRAEGTGEAILEHEARRRVQVGFPAVSHGFCMCLSSKRPFGGRFQGLASLATVKSSF